MKLFNKIFSSFNKTSSINHEEIFIEENEEEPEKEYEEMLRHLYGNLFLLMKTEKKIN